MAQPQRKADLRNPSIQGFCKCLYKMSFTNDACLVVGLKMDAGYMDKDRRRIVKPTPDCAFILTPDGKFALHEIKPDLDARFRQEDVVSIERLYPEWYFGFDFKPPKDIPYSVYTQRMPYKLPQGDLRHGGGVGCPKDFAAFVRSPSFAALYGIMRRNFERKEQEDGRRED